MNAHGILATPLIAVKNILALVKSLGIEFSEKSSLIFVKNSYEINLPLAKYKRPRQESNLRAPKGVD